MGAEAEPAVWQNQLQEEQRKSLPFLDKSSAEQAELTSPLAAERPGSSWCATAITTAGSTERLREERRQGGGATRFLPATKSSAGSKRRWSSFNAPYSFRLLRSLRDSSWLRLTASAVSQTWTGGAGRLGAAVIEPECCRCCGGAESPAADYM